MYLANFLNNIYSFLSRPFYAVIKLVIVKGGQLSWQSISFTLMWPTITIFRYYSFLPTLIDYPTQHTLASKEQYRGRDIHSRPKIVNKAAIILAMHNTNDVAKSSLFMRFISVYFAALLCGCCHSLSASPLLQQVVVPSRFGTGIERFMAIPQIDPISLRSTYIQFDRQSCITEIPIEK